MTRGQRIVFASVAALFAALAAAGVIMYVSGSASDDAVATPSTLSPAEQRTRGAYLARAGDCIGCHTRRGGEPFAGGLELPTPFGTFVTPNITPDAETGIGRWTAQDFWLALHEGKGRDGRLLYPAFPYTEYTKVTRADSDALFAWLQTLPAVTQRNVPDRLDFPYSFRPLLYAWRTLYFRPGVYAPDPRRDAEWNRGAYLVEGLGHCNACHATRNSLGATRGAALGGGVIAGSNWYAPSLTSSDEAGVGHWQPEEIADLLSTGVAAHGFVSGPMAEVVRNSLQHLAAADLRAMAVYLQSLPETTAPSSVPAQELDDAGRARVERGRPLYEKFCADCHGKSGEGAPGAYPPLAANRGVTLKTPLNAIRSVLDGGFPPATQGNPRPYGMPPFAQRLNSEEIGLVLSYARNAWGNRAGLVSAVDVERHRSETQ